MQNTPLVDDPDLAAFLGETVPTPAAPAPAPTSGGLDFLDGLNDQPKSKGKRKSYPLYPDRDGTAAALANKSIDLAGAKEQLESNNKLLGELVLPEWFRTNYRKSDTDSALKVKGTQGAVLVVCQARLKKMVSEEPLNPVRHLFNGEEKKLFQWGFDLKVEGDEIPPTIAPALVADLKAVFTKHGLTKALKVEKRYAPLPAFFSLRHQMFTPEQNLEINRAMPLVTQVKTKDVS